LIVRKGQKIIPVENLGPKANKYGRGDWFLVPLPASQPYIGRIVAGKAPILFGYFFAPMGDRPSAQDLARISPNSAVLRAKFGDLGLLEGRWQVIASDQLDPEWTLPPLRRIDVVSGEAYLVTYGDDLSRERECKRITPSEAMRFPSDSLYGYGAVEIELRRLWAVSQALTL
jgi:hypothetical protein